MTLAVVLPLLATLVVGLGGIVWRQHKAIQRLTATLAEKQAQLDWVDERERFLGPLLEGARYAMASNTPATSGFRGFFEHGMLSKQGVAAAPHLLAQHEALIAAHRGVVRKIRDAYEALVLWENAVPVPSSGVSGLREIEAGEAR